MKGWKKSLSSARVRARVRICVPVCVEVKDCLYTSRPDRVPPSKVDDLKGSDQENDFTASVWGREKEREGSKGKERDGWREGARKKETVSLKGHAL